MKKIILFLLTAFTLNVSAQMLPYQNPQLSAEKRAEGEEYQDHADGSQPGGGMGPEGDARQRGQGTDTPDKPRLVQNRYDLLQILIRYLLPPGCQ